MSCWLEESSLFFFFLILLYRKIKWEREMKRGTGTKAHRYPRCAVEELVGEGHLLLKGALDSVGCRKNQGETKLKVIVHVVLSYIFFLKKGVLKMQVFI